MLTLRKHLYISILMTTNPKAILDNALDALALLSLEHFAKNDKNSRQGKKRKPGLEQDWQTCVKKEPTPLDTTDSSIHYH